MKYTVLKHLHHEGRDYQPGGEIDIDGRKDDLEKRLIGQGVIKSVEQTVKAKAGAKDAATGG
jgi:hypothetical protein